MLKKYFSKEKLLYPFHVLTHPVDGFYEIRHRGMGSVPLAILIMIVFSFCFSMNRMMASFVVNDVDPRSVNSVTELGAVMLLYFLICVGNWSITCLMNGEGRFKDILTAVGYSFLPMIFAFVIGTVFSQIVANDETAFYRIIIGIGVIWTGALLLVGIMTIHNYTLGKTLVTLVLSFFSICLIIFIGIVFFDLIDQVFGFVKSVYTELLFRT